MGKSHKKRQMRRHNPMRVPDSHLPKGLASASAAAPASKTQAVLPIIQKMESADAGDRKWACVAVSNLIQNDPSTRRLLQGRNVVGALITRLTDSEEEVAVEAAGALRNLCIDGGYDICAEMYNKNILAPLKTFIPKISTTLAQFLSAPKTAPEGTQRVVHELADNVITILWCLSETSNKALNAVNQIGLVPFLMSFLASRDKLPLAAVTAAAQCLYVLSDDNKPVVDELRRDAGHAAHLLAIVHPGGASMNGKAKEPQDERSTTLHVLATGVLRNISPLPSPAPSALEDLDKEVALPLLLPVISSVSLLDFSNEADELVKKGIDPPPIEKLSLKNAPKSDYRSDAELQLERMEARLRTVQLALEVLTGVCATLPEPEPELDAPPDEVSGEDDDMLEAEGPDDTNMVTEDADVDTAAGLRTLSASTFLPSLVSPLLALAHPVPLSFPPPDSPSPHPPTTSALSAIHVSALECLNNVFLSLAASGSGPRKDAQSGREVWEKAWAALSESGERAEIWEAGVGVLWGIGNVWKGNLVPNAEHVNLLIRLCESSSDEQTRTKCIGTLECLAQHRESVAENKLISEYLMSLLPTPTAHSRISSEPLLQAVSALIDIYSDETAPYDVNFRLGGYVERLAGAVDGVRRAVRAIDRKKEGGKAMRARGEQVRETLEEFVEYRRGLGI